MKNKISGIVLLAAALAVGKVEGQSPSKNELQYTGLSLFYKDGRNDIRHVEVSRYRSSSNSYADRRYYRSNPGNPLDYVGKDVTEIYITKDWEHYLSTIVVSGFSSLRKIQIEFSKRIVVELLSKTSLHNDGVYIVGEDIDVEIKNNGRHSNFVERKSLQKYPSIRRFVKNISGKDFYMIHVYLHGESFVLPEPSKLDGSPINMLFFGINKEAPKSKIMVLKDGEKHANKSE